MAHNITDTDKMFSVREMPWHGLGVILPEYPTREEAQKLVHDWEPVPAPVYQAIPSVTDSGELTTEYRQIEGSQVIERSDNGGVIGVTNSTLGLITNTEMWDVAEAVGSLDQDLMIETAGSLRGGANVWILLKFAEPLTIKGDPSATLAMFSLQNSHDGSGAFRGQAHNVRIVCANTSSMADTEAKNSGHEFKFRHSINVGDRVEEAKRAVSMWRSEVAEWVTVMEFLADVQVSEAQVTEFVERFQPDPRGQISERVRGNIDKARGEVRKIILGHTDTMTEGLGHTAYGLFQAGIEWTQHYRGTRGKTEVERMESHFKRAVLNDGGVRQSTLQLVKEVAGV